MAGKLKNVSFHLLLFLTEITLLLAVIMLIKTESSVDSNVVLPSRNRRSLIESEIEEESELSRSPLTQPRTSPSCRKIYDYWTKACLPQSENPDMEQTAKKNIGFIQAFLDYFKSYLNKQLGFDTNTAKEEFPLFRDPIPEEPLMESENTLPRGDTFEGNVGDARLSQSNLSSVEKCRRDGLEGSIACQFEYDHPGIAAKLFQYLQPLISSQNKETLNQGTINGVRDEEEPILTSVVEPRGVRRKRNAILKSPILGHLRRIRSLSQQKRKRREVADATDREVCFTQYSRSNLIFAIHVTTGTRVSLYVFRGAESTQQIHTQLFETGTCRTPSPVANIAITSTSRPVCKEARSRVLAYIMVRNTLATMGRYNVCRPIGSTEYAVCRDWIFVPSQCKLYLA